MTLTWLVAIPAVGLKVTLMITFVPEESSAIEPETALDEIARLPTDEVAPRTVVPAGIVLVQVMSVAVFGPELLSTSVAVILLPET